MSDRPLIAEAFSSFVDRKSVFVEGARILMSRGNEFAEAFSLKVLRLSRPFVRRSVFVEVA